MTENEKRARARTLTMAVDELARLVRAGYTAAVMIPRLARAYGVAASAIRIQAEIDRRVDGLSE